jgi:DNA integrity scanning protein DisA with diadenylate cyclase activity
VQGQRRAENKNRQLVTQLDETRESKETVDAKLKKLERDNRILIEDTAIAAQRFAKYLRINNELSSKIGDISSATARLNELHTAERNDLERKLQEANKVTDQKNNELQATIAQLNALMLRYKTLQDSVWRAATTLKPAPIDTTAGK